ncbi:MAG: NADPH-dependent FMN reductase [Myxococcaceae bacterium]
MPDVIALCGSYRSKSLNRKLLRLAVREVEQLGLSVEQVDLKTLALPVYDGDVEESSGIPQNAVELKAKISTTPGLLIVSPEYNGSIPGGLKNFIDWLSRPPGNCFAGRVVSINNASDGAFGGARSTIAIKQSLTHLGCWIVPGAMNLPRADKAFDDSGELTEAWMKKALAGAMKTFVDGVKRFR